MEEKHARQPVPPIERKREVMDLISQGTRHRILQTILGHPEHLPTLAELDHMIPSKSTSTIEEAAKNLVDGGVVAIYEVSNEEIKDSGRSARDNPNKFYGLSEDGVRTLDEFEFLRSVPILRAVYDNTTQTETTQRHQAAIRPNLPESVASALAFDEQSAEAVASEPEAYDDMFASDASETDEAVFDELFETEG